MYLEKNGIADAVANVLTSASPDVAAIMPEDAFWIFVDCFLFITIVLGNVLTIVAIAVTRRLRNVISNYLVLNLAVSDLLVGISLPYHLVFYLHNQLNHEKLICVLRFVLISVACGSSIYNIMMIAIDRYIAIVHPLSYNAYATKKRMLLIIAGTWICTIGVSSIPIYWNSFETSLNCDSEMVLPRSKGQINQIQKRSQYWTHSLASLLLMLVLKKSCLQTHRNPDIISSTILNNAIIANFIYMLLQFYKCGRNYIVAIQMPSFLLAWVTMFLLYLKIWKEAELCARRMNLSIISNFTEKHDRRSVHVVLMILGCFTICWLPYFVVACMQSFGWMQDPSHTWYKITFALALANSGMNPLIYAWKNTNFRRAFQRILRLKSPNNKLNSSFKVFLEQQHNEIRSKQKEDTESDHRVSANDGLPGHSSEQQNNRAEEESRVENTTL